MNTAAKMRNIGPKSAAWLRQVGVRTLEDIATLGVVDVYLRVKRAGFKPSMNLLYALEGAMLDCHWQDVPQERREQLLADAEAGIAKLPPPRGRPAAMPVTTTTSADHEAAAPTFDFLDSASGSSSDSE